MELTELNLPKFEFIVRQHGQRKQIFDRLRRRFVALTPEEWVRQHFVRYLTDVKNYPAPLISIEKGVSLVSGTKRTDLVVHNRNGKPWMIVECKAPDVVISDETLFQAARYNMAHNASYLVLTNGMEHFCCSLLNLRIEFLNDLPAYDAESVG